MEQPLNAAKPPEPLQASAAAAVVGEKTKVAADAAAAGVVGAGDALDAVGTDR
jgi:hypothetical protein